MFLVVGRGNGKMEMQMKYLVFWFAFATVSAAHADTADDQLSALSCKVNGDLAFTLMTNSQNGITMDAMLKLLEGRHYSADVNISVRIMLDKVYAQPMFTTTELKAKAAIDFRDKIKTDCRLAVLEGK